MTAHINSFNFAEETIHGDVAVCNDYRWWDEVAVDYKPYEPYGAFCIEVNGQRIILSNMDKPTLQRGVNVGEHIAIRGFHLLDLTIDYPSVCVRVTLVRAGSNITTAMLSPESYSAFLQLLTTPTHP